MGSTSITHLLGYPYTRGVVGERSCGLRALGSSQLETGDRGSVCRPRNLPRACGHRQPECDADRRQLRADDRLRRRWAGCPQGQHG